jgi:hypothetical protein
MNELSLEIIYNRSTSRRSAARAVVCCLLPLYCFTLSHLIHSLSLSLSHLLITANNSLFTLSQVNNIAKKSNFIIPSSSSSSSFLVNSNSYHSGPGGGAEDNTAKSAWRKSCYYKIGKQRVGQHAEQAAAAKSIHSFTEAFKAQQTTQILFISHIFSSSPISINSFTLYPSLSCYV